MKKAIILWLLLASPACAELKYVNCILKENTGDVPIQLTFDESTQMMTMAVKRYSTRNEAVFSPSAVNWSVTTGLDAYKGSYAISRVAPLRVSKLATGFRLTQGSCELAEVPKQIF